MRQMIQVIWKVFLFTFFPTLCIYSARSDNFLDAMQRGGIIGPKINLVACKDILLIIGILLSAVLLSVNLACTEIREKKSARQRDSLIKYNKDIFLKALGNRLNISCLHLNQRIFVPSKDKLALLKICLNKLGCHLVIKEAFTIKNIVGLSDPGITENLSFEIRPNEQGLVGKCYSLRTIIYDDNLKATNATDYNLTPYQKSKTCDLEFILCAPLFR
jgi:hypothetical protein